MVITNKQISKLIAILLAVFGLSVSALSQAAVIWDGHSDGDDHVYEVVYLPEGSWGDAYTAASLFGEGWQLATVTSSAEQAFLQDNLFVGLTGKYWLGGWQDDTAITFDEGWNWVTGETWDYTNWAISEPDDFGGQDQRWLLTDNAFNWQWGDFRWESLSMVGFIAEKSVPEPGSIALLGVGLILIGFTRRKKMKL